MNSLNNKDKSIQEEIRNIKNKTLKVLTFGFLVLLSCLLYWVYFEENLLIEKKTKKIDVDNLKESNHEERYNIVWIDDNTVSISMVFEISVQGLKYNFSTNTLEIEYKCAYEYVQKRLFNHVHF